MEENLYYHVNHDNPDGVLSTTSTLPLTGDCRLIVNNPFDEKKVLEESLRPLLERRSNEGGSSNKYKIIDVYGSEIPLEDLFEKYYFNEKYHTLCSVVVDKISEARSKMSTTLKETA